MAVVGIVSEYNPFHLGHSYHIETTKKALNPEGVICVMSGSFVQRGAPACLDKWTRAKMALLSGVDLVLELPVGYSLNAADYFAKGAIELLDATGVITHISFGSESGDLDALKAYATAETPEESALVKKHLSSGQSYAKAVGLSKETALGPNDILGISYLKALKGTDMEPFTLPRLGDYHSLHADKSSFASASAVREMIGKCEDYKPYVSAEAAALIEEMLQEGAYIKGSEVFGEAVLAKLRGMTEAELQRVSEISEGLENRILEIAKKAGSYEELMRFVKTKRYAYARLSRIMMKVYLGLKAAPGKPCYFRVLGMTKKGRELLKEMKEKATLPILTKIAQNAGLSDGGKEMLADEIRATDLYVLGYSNPLIRTGGLDYKTSPVVLND